MTGDLLAGLAAPSAEPLGDGAVLLRAFALDEAPALLTEIQAIAKSAPFRHLITPGGFRMSVAMTNCGTVGWISDQRGYRYGPDDPETDRPWPAMPQLFKELAARAADAAGFPAFAPEACLINRYEPGARLTLHQDRDEGNLSHPIVSVSLGVPATFLFGGLDRKDRPRRIRVEHGDVAIWGGPSRLAFHGIDPLKPGEHPLTGVLRYNLTFRKAL